MVSSTKKGHTMDTTARYYIYNETKNGTQINNENTVKPNRIYKAILQGEADRLHVCGRPTTDPP